MAGIISQAICQDALYRIELFLAILERTLSVIEFQKHSELNGDIGLEMTSRENQESNESLTNSSNLTIEKLEDI